MPDGNITAAKTRLVQAVARLCDPRTTLIAGHPHTADSLYDTLRSDIAGRQGETKTPAKSLPPIWIDASMLITTIDRQSRSWQPRGDGTCHRLRLLSWRPWRPQDHDRVTAISRDITGWCDQIGSMLDPISRKSITAACPSCGRRHVYRKDSAGEMVRRDALEITAAGCVCLHCDAAWAPDRYLWLIKLLGFDLPAGVLE